MAKRVREKSASGATANIIAKAAGRKQPTTRAGRKQDQATPDRPRRQTLKSINERLMVNHAALLRKAAVNAKRLIGRPSL